MGYRFDSANFVGYILFIVVVVLVMLGICGWAAGCAARCDNPRSMSCMSADEIVEALGE